MRRPLAALLAAAISFALVALLHAAGLLDRLELITLDARYATGIGRKTADPDIVVAWIDQDSMDYMAKLDVPFPWPRSVYAEAMRYMQDGGAKAVVYDVIFDQPGNADDDREFGKALQGAKGDVLAMKFLTSAPGVQKPEELAALYARGRALAGAGGARQPGVTLPIPELTAGADALGFVNVVPDADKVYRRYGLWRAWSPAGQAPREFPSLAEAALPFAGAVAVNSAARTDADGRILLNFRGPEFSFEHVKFVNILESINQTGEGKAPLYSAERFKDKVVIVGINAEGYEDIHPTPLSRVFPGPELHATALDNLRHQDWLVQEPWDLQLAGATSVVAAALVFALPSVPLAMTVLLLVLALFVGAVGYAFGAQLVLPVAAPVLAGTVAAGGSFLYRLVVEGKQKREMRRAFGSYMAPEVLEAVLKDPANIALGGQTREVTLLFTDLAGFTGLSEHIGPEALVRFLNDYFTRMCEPVLQQHGIIDKFIGDAIMAMFGAPLPMPDHALRAVRAAMLAGAVSEAIAAELQKQGKPAIETRIGVHTGPAVVGNMGSAKRFDYTAIGDTVNLASRLEGANKAFGTRCMVSETSWRSAAAEVLGREIGRVGVKGREQPIAVFEPLAPRSSASAEQLAFVEHWQAALHLLRAGDRPAARAAFTVLASQRPGDALCKLYVQSFKDPFWDGVFRLDSK